MRDLALVLTIAILVPLSVPFPLVGLFAWEWLSIMNPHRLTWGFSYQQPFVMIVALVTIIGWVLSRERGNLKPSFFLALLIIFSAWMSITTLYAPTPEITVPLWDRTIKTMIMIVMVLALVSNRVRIDGLVWVLVLSLAYYGIKGGGFVLLSGGANIVFGPKESMIEDNNTLALALLMVLPLMNYLRLQTPNRWLRYALAGGMFLTFIAAIGSYSRGAMVALVAILGYLWLKSSAKLITAPILVCLLMVGVMVMPAKYMDRLNTLENVMEDESFRGRLDAWEVAWEVAKDNPLGAGFEGPRQPVVWNDYLPDRQARAAHSIYFMVIGEHGFIGLGIYLLIFAVTWWNLFRIRKLTKAQPELKWARDLGFALEVSMVGFMVGGAALSMAYYDGFLTLVALTEIVRRLVQEAVNPAQRRAKIPVRTGAASTVRAPAAA
ncbi:MAG: putative O-glycosylation ligase, exosortase A system-associated [Rhodospirillaceae bacterium]